MPWPFGKPRPKKDREAISRGKKGKPRTQAERDKISEGQKRAWWRRKNPEDDEETTE